MPTKSYYKVIAENRKARHDFEIMDTCVAGIVLRGSEVKSVRAGSVTLRDSFARVEKGELWLYGMHITPYRFGAAYNPDPLRIRKLLVKKNELGKLAGKVSEKGLTLVPLKLYFQGNFAKLELGVAKARKLYNKREKLRQRTMQRELERVLRGRNDE